jgi:hypothetical protein
VVGVEDIVTVTVESDGIGVARSGTKLISSPSSSSLSSMSKGVILTSHLGTETDLLNRLLE